MSLLALLTRSKVWNDDHGEMVGKLVSFHHKTMPVWNDDHGEMVGKLVSFHHKTMPHQFKHEFRHQVEILLLN
jgi:hypothetical protein